MTRGQYLVGVSFNPSGLSRVDYIKKAAAQLIDAINRVEDGSETPPDTKAMKQVAQERAVDAAMWGVKAATLQHPTNKGDDA